MLAELKWEAPSEIQIMTDALACGGLSVASGVVAANSIMSYER